MESLNLCSFNTAHLVLVWPDKGWTVLDVPPSWFSMMELKPVFYVEA